MSTNFNKATLKELKRQSIVIIYILNLGVKGLSKSTKKDTFSFGLKLFDVLFHVGHSCYKNNINFSTEVNNQAYH